MVPALLGLLGVMAGALLGGIATHLVETQKLRASARAAARLVAAEMKSASDEMHAMGEVWEPGELSTRIYTEQATALPALLTIEQLGRLQTAYGHIEDVNTRRALHPGKPLSEKDKELLEQFERQLREVEKETLDATRTSRPVATTRTILVATLLTLGLVALFVPRENVTADTVTRALEATAGNDVIAECDPDGEDWLCVVYELAAERSDCLTEGDAAGGGMERYLAQAADSRILAALGTCEVARPPAPVQVFDEADRLLVTAPSTTSGRAISARPSPTVAPGSATGSAEPSPTDPSSTEISTPEATGSSNGQTAEQGPSQSFLDSLADQRVRELDDREAKTNLFTQIRRALFGARASRLQP